MPQVVLVTGASSGLGLAIAGHLSANGYRVYGTSRNSASAPAGWSLIQMDVTRDDSVVKAIHHILDRESRLDVLINNAGMGIAGPVETCSDEEILSQFETNFFGLARLCRAVIPAMRTAGRGTIINISSIGGLMGLPYQGFYSATKFAVEGFSEALAMEVKPFGIQVSVINPGDFATGFTAARKVAHSSENNPYRSSFDKTLARIEQDENHGSDPKKLALLVERIIRSKKPKYRYLAGRFDQRLMARLKPLLPPCLSRWILENHYNLNR